MHLLIDIILGIAILSGVGLASWMLVLTRLSL